MSTRIIGIDYGSARIGMSISDERKIIAMPLPNIETARNSEKTIQRVLERLRELEEKYNSSIEKIIVGMPFKFSGKMSLQSDEVQEFINLLRQATPIPIQIWDERLTTVQAERSLREANLSRKKRAKIVDAVSAVIILQNYLDSIYLRDNV